MKVALASSFAAVAFSATVKDVTIDFQGCRGNKARVHYGSKKGPALSFAHGFGAGGTKADTSYTTLLNKLADSGYVVIVPETSNLPLECKKLWEDQVQALNWLKSSEYASKVDYTKKTGVIGHSMGGGATYHTSSQTASIKAENIGAAVPMNPQAQLMNLQPIVSPEIPVLFTTGSSDTTIKPSSVKELYSKATSKVPKVFAEISGGGHTEPCEGNPQRLNDHVLAFFDCHLKSSSSQCQKIYKDSSSGALCGGKVKMTECSHANEPSYGFKEIAERVNALGTSWTAAEPAKFESVEDVKPFLGTILKGEEGYVAMAKEISDVPNGVEVPASFDVRTAFPDCAEVSGNIRDQSSCGSCWAFGATEAFNDRHCIATGNKVKLSVEDTTANCGLLQCFSMGCGGGQPGMAWNWFESHGVVTGGDYFDIGSGSTCAPYSLAPCAHHVPATAKYPACPSSEYPTPSLSKCSESGYSKGYSDDKIKASDSYSLSGVASIQADIVQYGSATAGFTVYDDFPTYKSGVYHKTSNKQLGGHAVKFLGWGTENGQDYWLVANSWNEQWGDGGTFKIRRGNNECGIEGQVSAGRAGSSDIVA